MGCDIHIFAETKNKTGEWMPVTEPVFASTLGDSMTARLYDGRNYQLFSILADVRNGIGFGGCDTGDRLNPISDPKGLPEDVSKEVAEKSDSWGEDGHSHSFFMLKELLDYDWDQESKLRGFVSFDQYRYYKKHGKPISYCGNISGNNVKIITNEQMEEAVQNGVSRDDLYTKVEWGETYKECVGYFYSHTIPALKKLGGPDEVRIVFWFDN